MDRLLWPINSMVIHEVLTISILSQELNIISELEDRTRLVHCFHSFVLTNGKVSGRAAVGVAC
jgi:hypothetical protein